MKRVLHYLKVFFYVAGVIWFVSCNEKELPETGNGEEELSLEPTPEDLRSLRAWQIINNLCEVDSVNGSATYDFKIGKVLDATRPTEFSIGVDNLEEAVDFFRSSILGGLNEPIDLNGVLSLDLQEQGSLVFAPGGDNGALATLTVNLVNLPAMTKLHFISSTLWPDNASSPYVRGNILYDKIDKCYYLCIAGYNEGRKGVLFTLEKGWSYSVLDDKDEMTDKGYKFVIYKGFPAENDFKVLLDYYTNHHDEFMPRLLLAFPEYRTKGLTTENDKVFRTSSRTYPINAKFEDVLSGWDWCRNDLENLMREHGFHMDTKEDTYWFFEVWHKFWYNAYRLRRNNGGVYELQYINTRNFSFSITCPILCSMRFFEDVPFDKNRYDLKRK